MLLYEIINHCRKTTAMSSVHKLERLVSNCSLSGNSDTFSMYEAETPFVMQKALSGDQTVLKVENDSGVRSVYDDKKQSCSESVKCSSKKEDHNDLLLYQKYITNDISLKVKDPFGKQLYNPTEELSKLNITYQDNIYDGHDILLTDGNIGNLEEPLQNSTIQKYSKTRGKVSPITYNGKKIKKFLTSNSELQTFGRKDLTKLKNRIQKLQQEFHHLCLLISNLLNILKSDITPNLLVK